MSDDMESAATEQETAPGVPFIVRHQQAAADPEDWEEEWFMAPATHLDKRDSWADDLERLSRGLRVSRKRKRRGTLPWPGRGSA